MRVTLRTRSVTEMTRCMEEGYFTHGNVTTTSLTTSSSARLDARRRLRHPGSRCRNSRRDGARGCDGAVLDLAELRDGQCDRANLIEVRRLEQRLPQPLIGVVVALAVGQRQEPDRCEAVELVGELEEARCLDRDVLGETARPPTVVDQ